MSELGIGTVGELVATPLPRLEAVFGEKDAQWLATLARGITGGNTHRERTCLARSCFLALLG